jgi:hypothetical protein
MSGRHAWAQTQRHHQIVTIYYFRQDVIRQITLINFRKQSYG